MANGAYDSLVAANKIAFNFGVDDPEHIRRIERYVRIGGREVVEEALSDGVGLHIETVLDQVFQIVTSKHYRKMGRGGLYYLRGRRDSDQRQMG